MLYKKELHGYWYLVWVKTHELKNQIASFLIVLGPLILVFIEPDIGTASVFIAIWLGLSIVGGLKLKQLLLLVTFGLIFAFLLFQILAPYQKERIRAFLSPQADPLRAGYSIIQSKIAIGSGQFLGHGAGQGSQSQLKFLPEAESDFIFASLAEQLGFLGTSLILIIFSFSLKRIVDIAQAADKFGQFLCFGTASVLLFQFAVNVGMNMGLLPITGITFPLVSYGGSSLFSTLILLGTTFSIKRYPKSYY